MADSAQHPVESEDLDCDLLRQARETYGDYVPEFIEEYKLGDLWAYKITRMQGVPVYTMRANPPGNVDDSPFCRTVLDFARFCAAALKNRPANLPPPRATLQNEYLAALHKIGRLLPDRFRADVDLARDAAWRLFEGDWPMVINNGNVMRPNMLVRDAASGALAGLLAWSTAEVSPWGMMVPAVETILGHMRYDGTWTRVAGYARLRRFFYDELDRELGWRVQDSRLDGVYVLGLLLQQAPHSLGSSWRTLDGVLPDNHPAISFLASTLLGQG